MIKKKCDKYWPKFGESVIYDDITITLKSEEYLLPDGILMRELILHTENTTRTIIQLQIICWPDHDIPEKSQGYNMLEIIISYIDEYRNKNIDAPIIIHCR